MENQTHTGAALPSHDLLDDLNHWLEHAEKRYNEEQEQGDAISVASTLATFLAVRDVRALVRKHVSANT